MTLKYGNKDQARFALSLYWATHFFNDPRTLINNEIHQSIELFVITREWGTI